MNYKGAILRMLKDYGAYNGYIRNFKKLKRYGDTYDTLNDKSFDKFFKLFLELRGGKNKKDTFAVFYYFINDSFLWDKTKEGSNYWCGILDKFKLIGKILTNRVYEDGYDLKVNRKSLEYSNVIRDILNKK